MTESSRSLNYINSLKVNDCWLFVMSELTNLQMGNIMLCTSTIRQIMVKPLGAGLIPNQSITAILLLGLLSSMAEKVSNAIHQLQQRQVIVSHH